MKKAILILSSLFTLSTVFAQADFHNRKSEPVATAYHEQGASINAKDKNAQIQKINREFDRKIAAVRRNRHLAPFEKERQVRLLDRQRAEQIQMVNGRFSKSQVYKGSRYDKRTNERW